jgi:hypothetical protein
MSLFKADVAAGQAIDFQLPLKSEQRDLQCLPGSFRSRANWQLLPRASDFPHGIVKVSTENEASRKYAKIVFPY